MIILVSFSLSPATSWGRHLNNINRFSLNEFGKKNWPKAITVYHYHDFALSSRPFETPSESVFSLQHWRTIQRLYTTYHFCEDFTNWRLHELKTSRGSVPRRWRSVPCAACCAKRPRRKKTTSRSWCKNLLFFWHMFRVTVEVLFRVRCFAFFVLRCWVLEDTELSAFQPCQPFHGAESYYEWLRQVPQRVLWCFSLSSFKSWKSWKSCLVSWTCWACCIMPKFGEFLRAQASRPLEVKWLQVYNLLYNLLWLDFFFPDIHCEGLFSPPWHHGSSAGGGGWMMMTMMNQHLPSFCCQFIPGLWKCVKFHAWCARCVEHQAGGIKTARLDVEGKVFWYVWCLWCWWSIRMGRASAQVTRRLFLVGRHQWLMRPGSWSHSIYWTLGCGDRHASRRQ